MQTFRRVNRPYGSKLESGFRLIHMFTIEHNAMRLKHHLKTTLRRNDSHRRWARLARLKKRFHARKGVGVAR